MTTTETAPVETTELKSGTLVMTMISFSLVLLETLTAISFATAEGMAVLGPVFLLFLLMILAVPCGIAGLIVTSMDGSASRRIWFAYLVNGLAAVSFLAFGIVL